MDFYDCYKLKNGMKFCYGENSKEIMDNFVEWCREHSKLEAGYYRFLSSYDLVDNPDIKIVRGV